MQIERKYLSLEMPSKMKIGVSGCPNSCTESRMKDVGVAGRQCQGRGECVDPSAQARLDGADGAPGGVLDGAGDRADGSRRRRLDLLGRAVQIGRASCRERV